MEDAEVRLRAYWDSQGVPKDRQDETIASITAKAQPGAKVGPFTIGKPKTLQPEDFTYSATAEGYMLKYKGQNIGGASILGKYRGNQREKQIREYAEDARRELKSLLLGSGQARFTTAIEQIDADASLMVSKPQDSKAIEVLKEFIRDVEAVGYEETCKDWPDLSLTYDKAKKIVGV